MEIKWLYSIVVKLGTPPLRRGRPIFRQRAWSNWCASWPSYTTRAASGTGLFGRHGRRSRASGLSQLPKLLLPNRCFPRLAAPPDGLYEQLFDIYKLTVATGLAYPHRPGRSFPLSQFPQHLSALLSQRVIPIINENDTVATERSVSAIMTIYPRWWPTDRSRPAGDADRPVWAFHSRPAL